MFNICKNLWQGGLPRDGIPKECTAVISVCPEQCDNFYDVHVCLPIFDGPSPGLKWLKTAVSVLDTLINNGHTVYVHCYAGWSRSVMLVAAYLIHKYQYSVDQALENIAKINTKIDPAPAFIKLLKEYISCHDVP